MKLLVVDDHPLIVHALREVLPGLAGDVDLVHDGVEDEHLGGEVRRGRRVAVGAVQEQRPAVLTGLDEPPQLLVPGVEATHETDLHERAAEREARREVAR